MLKSKSLLVLLLLMTTAAFAAPASSDGLQASAVPIKTFLRADLSLKSVMIVPEVAQPAAGKTTPVAFLRTCRCSCGQPCKTNADCGAGGICAAGITCCNRTPGKSDRNALNSIFQQKDELSSSRYPSLAAVTVDCKQK
ncbi:MAG: hypothetical protein LAP21_12645 [Acidobacteriia bacterium]|nr:hypothetical protein [Terriglobia bacterium]